MLSAEEPEVKPRPWTEEEFRRLAELGLLSARATRLRDGAIYEGDKPRRWSGIELYRLLDLGFFVGERIELIDGAILAMAAQKNLHAVGITLTEDALRLAFGPGFWIRVQMSLDLTPYSVPDPDLAVVRGSPRTLPLHQNPTSALLLVGVSETTLRYDRDIKGSLHARVGIVDYWILNLVARRLEVYRSPVVDASKTYGMTYADISVLAATEVISPLAVAQASIAVADLLP
jgi:Uma2 family endonuclease